VRANTRSGLIALAIIAGVGTAALAATAAVATTATPAATTSVTSVAAVQPRIVAPAITGIHQVARPGGQGATARVAGQMTPAASSPEDSFSEVSCLNPKDCIGVGGNALGNGGYGAPLDGLWNGSSWRNGTSPLPSGALGGELYSISCKPGGCVAVGYYWSGPQKYVPLAEFWNGARWSLLSNPALPSGALSGLLSEISCTTDKSCTPVGYYQLSNATGGLLETWNGSAWHVVHLPSPKTAASALSGVSCSTAAYCVAVGTYVGGTNNANSYALADVLSGGTWHLGTPANPNTAAGYQDVLQSVSCAPSSTTPMCVAVGTVGKQSGKVFYATGFGEAWNGATWSPQTLTWPSGSHSVLYGVSCPSTTECVAVGGTGVYAAYNDGTKAAQVWNGANWSLATLPAASGGVGSVFYGVQCLPATTPSCAAAGEVGPYTTPGHALTGFWSGTAWKLVTTA
jgi:hypothetical protein